MQLLNEQRRRAVNAMDLYEVHGRGGGGERVVFCRRREGQKNCLQGNANCVKDYIVTDDVEATLAAETFCCRFDIPRTF